MDFENEKNITIFTHPLIQHKISILRDKKTGTNEFRKLVEEIAMLEGFEALSDLPTEDVEIETPIETCMTPMISGRKLAIVPILRAGLGMVPGVLSLVPTAKVGHIGMYRNEETHEPVPYYCKLPHPIEERTIVVTDPMLATGGSAVDAIDQIKKVGGKQIKFMCIIAAPEGVEKLHKAHPDVQIYIGHLDRELNADAYINWFKKIVGIRSVRHIFKKEVIIHDPDYPRLTGDLEQLTAECRAYAAKKRLEKAPNYFKLWMSSEDDNEVMAINEKLEALVEEMSNTKSATLIGALNNYPVISVSAHVRPFHIYWLNLVAGVIFPIGLFFYFRIWAFRVRLAKDMERIIKNNEQIQFIIQKINK